ncbi:MAG: T9SS type A sorting domain-containing protein [Crocinitomicaceae bacterium]
MRITFFIILLCAFAVRGQQIDYIPSKQITQTVDANYYDTEYIYFTVQTDDTLELYFELVKDTATPGWQRSLCNNMVCYNYLAEDGPLGTFSDGDQGYMSISLSTGDSIGEGIFSYRIYDPEKKGLDDTISFRYEVLDSEQLLNQPWVKINYDGNVLYTLFKNPQIAAKLQIFDLNGKLVMEEQVSGTFSYSLNDLRAGIFIVKVSSETGQTEVQRIIKQ